VQLRLDRLRQVGKFLAGKRRSKLLTWRITVANKKHVRKPKIMRESLIDEKPKLSGNNEAGAMFRSLAETIVSRTMLEDRLGKSYYPSTGGGAKRDLYKTLGYLLIPEFNDYYARYRRQDVAKRIVDAPVSASWRKKPAITELELGEKQTEFEKGWLKLQRDKRVFHYLSRGDRIAGIGRFGIILLGFGDGMPLNKPVGQGKALHYLRPYTESSIEVLKWEENTKNERYGLPLIYGITTNVRGSSVGQGKAIGVHYSRTIHIAEGLVDDDVLGTPRLEAVLNRLHDIELISGGSSEMFWRGGFPGYAFKLEPDAQVDPQALEDLEDEIQDYLHELQRYIRLQGIDVKALEVQVADPSSHIDMLISLISAATGIPKRILTGSERGELASSQDERAWADRIDERRKDHCEPVILRAFIDKMILTGVLPAPSSGDYQVVWPDMIAIGEKDLMEIAQKAMDAFQKYISSGGDTYLPFEVFAKKFLKFDDNELKQMKEIQGRIIGNLMNEPEGDDDAILGLDDGDGAQDGAAETTVH
jgi:hypothetical protein